MSPFSIPHLTRVFQKVICSLKSFQILQLIHSFYRTWSPIYSKSLSRHLPLSVPTRLSRSFTSLSSCPQTARMSDYSYSEKKSAKPLKGFSSQTKLKSQLTNWRPANHRRRRCRLPKTTLNWCVATPRSCTRSPASSPSWCRLCPLTEFLPLTLFSWNRVHISAIPCSGSGKTTKGLGTLMDSTIAGKEIVQKKTILMGLSFCLFSLWFSLLYFLWDSNEHSQLQ